MVDEESQQALVLDIYPNYDFIVNNVLPSDSDIINPNLDSLLMQSFLVFLMGGNTECFLWDLDGIVEDLEYDYEDTDNPDGFEDEPLTKLSESVADVDEVSVDGGGGAPGKTHFFVVDPLSDEAGKRLLLRALALAFWVYLRDTVFDGEYDVDGKVNNPAVNWIKHLDENSFEVFLNEDFNIDWFVENMTDACWHYDDADRVQSMEDLVE